MKPKVRIFPFFLDWQGDGVEQNEAEAIKLIKLSAEQVTLRNVCVYALLLVLHSSSFYIRLRSFLRVITHKNVVWLIVIWMQQKQVWPIAKDAYSQINQSEGKTNRCSRVKYGKMKWPIISFSFAFNCCKSVFSLSRQTFRYFIDKSIISRLLLLLFLGFSSSPQRSGFLRGKHSPELLWGSKLLQKSSKQRR